MLTPLVTSVIFKTYTHTCIYVFALLPDRGYKEYLDKENHHEKQSYDR